MKRITSWSEIRPGACWDVHSDSPVASAIRHFTGRSDLLDAAGNPLPEDRSPNHSGVVCGMRDGEPYSMEALSKVEIHPLSTYRAEWDRGDLHVFCPAITDNALCAALTWLLAQEGAGYGWGQIAGFTVVQRLRQWLHWETSPVFRAGMICSEVQVRYLREAARVDHSAELRWVFQVPDLNSFSPAAALYCKQFDRLPATL